MHNTYPAGRPLQINRSCIRWKNLTALLPWLFATVSSEKKFRSESIFETYHWELFEARSSLRDSGGGSNLSSWLTLCPGDTTLCSLLLSFTIFCSTLVPLNSGDTHFFTSALPCSCSLLSWWHSMAWGQTSPGTNPHFLSTGSLLLCVQLHGQYASLGTWAAKQGRKGENENNLFAGKNPPCSSPHAV